jgi:sodium-dependent dicarboxylate transporter 2/3/5
MAALAACVSEFCTNQVVVAAFLPIMYSFSNALDMNPIILMVTVTVSASFAFALPSGTPPTAIAMSTGEIELVDMVKYGFMFKLIAIVIFVPVFFLITMGLFGLGA